MIPPIVEASSRAETTIAFELLNQLVQPFFIRFTAYDKASSKLFFFIVIIFGVLFWLF
jgi:hypothetical protein